MNRAPIVLTATVAGVAATLGFQAHRPAPPTATRASAASSSSSSWPASSGATAAPSKTVTSAVETNRYGNVQLRVAFSHGRITAVQALQIPQGDGKSVQINAYAVPVLQRSALTAQSAAIDAVSGATYTSDSYKTALQSALDKARTSSPAGAKPS